MLLCLYFVYSIISIQIDVYKEKVRFAELERQIAALKLENDELMRQSTNGGEKEYLERVAREKLEYASPDERVFVDH